ncbi:MAG TPA: serine/threonine protein kinase [Treponemataceae bacterium]|nr:serine/threonine protein kinase [Treponemataceae bacterium]
MNQAAPTSGFAGLDPDSILTAIEGHLGTYLDGSLVPYNSYVNRVFGVADEDGNGYIAKFYRPGRWSDEAILEEHAFLADCAASEIPVVPPIAGSKTSAANIAPAEGNTPAANGTLSASKTPATLGIHEGFRFAVFPRVRARTFEIERDEDWLRAGRVIGRLHAEGARRKAPHRIRLTPEATTAKYVEDFLSRGLVHPDIRDEFTEACEEGLKLVNEAFDGIDPASFIRIHGDFHRGNLLAAGESAPLTVIDFDDMLTGPAVQDLWLLLPGHLSDSTREINLLLEGYEEFREFDRTQLSLVEPLRLMRQIYFLAWCAVQREDAGFLARNPDWGGRAFWITETEDLTTQLAYLRPAPLY